ncbi:MAG: PD40 domain-containing protein [Anaerolineaceae bacterium]|nr:PD40 domain-containing protein [Anaerolineaceae bacterium]
MREKKQILLAVVIILLTSLACSLPFNTGGPTPEEISETAAAAISATITAMAPEEAPTAITEPETPDSTPLPATDPTTIIKSRPDELRLAIVDSEHNLYTWQEGGSQNLIVNKGDVSQAVLSPDGEWIVFTRISPDGIDISLWAIRFDGREQKNLVSHVDFVGMPLHPDLVDLSTILTVAPHMIKFIPGTHTVVFNTYPQFDAPGFLDNKDLYYIDVDTAERRAFLSPGQAGQFYFSPDGTQMALVTPDRIDLLNTDGSNRRIGVLSYSFVYTYSEYAYHAVPVWSPDSSYLRVGIPPQDPLGDPTAPVNIYHIPTDGSLATLLTSVVVAPLDNVILAPDINHFTYKEQIGDPAENLYSLKFTDLSGSTPVEFTTGSLGFGAWALDSSHFYFINWNPREIFIGQVGIPGVIVLDVNPAMNFSWITSDRFLFIYQSGTNYQLRMGTLSTSSVEIADLGSGLGNPMYDFVSP